MLGRLAPALFVLSGIAGLMLQVAWYRLLAQSLGGSLAATTAVLSAFMFGLATGAWWLGRRASRLRDGVVAYGLLEAGAGAAALASLPLLEGVDAVYSGVAGHLDGSAPVLLLTIKTLLAGVVLVPATFCMGGTLPALCQSLARRPESSGTRTGWLYGLNTAGAVLGVLVALFWSLPELGLSATVTIAGTVQLLVAAVVLVIARTRRGRPLAAPTEAAAESGPTRTGGFAVLLFLVGLVGLAYEVLWTRLFAFYLGSGAYAFGVTLAAVLIGLALGGLLGGALSDRCGRPTLVFAASQALLCVVIGFQIWAFPALPDWLYAVAARLSGGVDFTRLVLLLLLGAILMILPASILMGAALPSAVRAVIRKEGESGSLVGRLLAANTFGTIPGAIVAAWILIPLLGTQGAMLALAALNGAVATAALLIAEGGREKRWAAWSIGLVLVVLTGIVLSSEPRQIYGLAVDSADRGRSAGEESLLMEESAHGTVTLSRITDDRGAWLSLSINAVNVAGTSPPLLSCQVLQGQLPLLLHADPRKVLHVGFGSGGTAAAVLSHPSVEQLDIAEINPAVPRVSIAEFPLLNAGVLEDERTRVLLLDGRNHVFSTRERYDAILSDSIHPRYGGNSNLYTVDYFRECRKKLAPGGLVSTWLPIYSLSPDSLRAIVLSMREVFPHTSLWYLNSTVNEFVVLIGRTEGPQIDVARIETALQEPSIRDSLATVGLHSSHALLDFFIAQGGDLDGFVGDVPLHHDDLPWVELESAAILDRRGSWRHNLAQVVAARTSVLPLVEGAEPGWREEHARWEAATTEQLIGQQALLAGDREAQLAAFERALALNPRDREPWEHFGAPSWVRTVAEDAAQRDPH